MLHRLTASRTMRKRVDNVIARALAAGELLKVDDDHYHWDGMHAQGFDVEEVAPLRVDRKSTRLNSSHDQISYAVFCLKKKNNISRRPFFITLLAKPQRRDD